MLTRQQIDEINQTLTIARQRIKSDPGDTMKTATYAEHIECLLIELQNAIEHNQRQSNSIREMIRRIETEANGKSVVIAG